jgi:hypothetical protein
MAKCQSAFFGFNWQIPIDFHQLPEPINAQPDKKIPILNIEILEEPLNQIVVLREPSKSREEVAVAQPSLSDVVGLHIIDEELRVAVDLLVVLPFEVGELVDFGVDAIFDDGLHGWWKRVVLVYFLTLLDSLCFI